MSETTQEHHATLGDLFSVSPKELEKKVTEEMSSSRQSRGWTDAVRGAVTSEVSRRYGELMGVELVDIMSGAWKKYAGLLQYTDKSKHPPEESILVPLGKHTIDSKHSPGIEVFLDNQLILKLMLDVVLALKFESVILRIENGRIREIRPGTVRAEGSIKYGTAALAELKSETIRIPGIINLGYGIEIR